MRGKPPLGRRDPTLPLQPVITLTRAPLETGPGRGVLEDRKRGKRQTRDGVTESVMGQERQQRPPQQERMIPYWETTTVTTSLHARPDGKADPQLRESQGSGDVALGML
jgi:hypothetical protein